MKFCKSAKWPPFKWYGKIATRPERTIHDGRHESIIPAQMEPSRSCMKQKDELLQISLIEAEKMNLGTVLHTSEERGSLVNTWAEKERSANRNEHCNREEHGQIGKHEKILNELDILLQ